MLLSHKVGKTIKWNKLKQRVQTGDILLCQTQSAFGLLEQVVTQASYTHICVFIRFTDTNNLVILESAMSRHFKDKYSGKTDGPKMIDADEYMRTYFEWENGVLTYRALRTYRDNLPLELSEHRILQLYCFMARVTSIDVVYERVLTDLLNSYVHYRDMGSSDPDFEFCSETVASVWVIMGVYINQVADKLVPKNFSEKYENVFDVKHNVGKSQVYLTKEVTIELYGGKKEKKKAVVRK